MRSNILPNEFRGMMLAALSGILFGSLGLLGTKLIQQHISVVNMLFWRFFIASIWIYMGLIFSRKRLILPPNHKLFLGKIFIFFTLCYSSGSAFYFIASEYIGTGLAMVIFFSFPIFVTLFAWLFDHLPLTKTIFLALLTVIFGLYLLKGNSDVSRHFMGVLLSLVASFCYAIYVYSNQHLTKIIDSRTLTLLTCVGATILFFIFSCYTHTFFIPKNWLTWLEIIAISVVATALPIQLLLDGLQYINPIKASILAVLEPVITVIFGVLFLNEMINFQQVIGIIIVLIGAIFIQFERLPMSQRQLLFAEGESS
ncbi:MAG: integral membrane protein [uncultured bacterium]|nr:MAG: integral membrane protein [uncultured bacterium]